MDGMLFLPLYESHADIRHRTEDFELLASEIQDKTEQNVATYYPVFRRKWKELSGIRLVLTRIRPLTYILIRRTPSDRRSHSGG
jgi:hypothetical protein